MVKDDYILYIICIQSKFQNDSIHHYVDCR